MGLAVVAYAAFVIYELLSSDDPNLATEAPVIPTSAASGADVGSGGGQHATGVQHFVVDSNQSLAKYVVKEDLNGVLDVTTVGQTSAISGDLYLSTAGVASTPESTFKVDMTTLKTDEARRDNFIRRNTLRTSQYPTAEFTIDSVQGFPTDYVENTEVLLTLSGTMTIRGTGKPVTWQVKARQAGDVLTATADTDIKMTDFGLNPPDVGFAKAKDDVHIQVVFVSNRVAA